MNKGNLLDANAVQLPQTAPQTLEAIFAIRCHQKPLKHGDP